MESETDKDSEVGSRENGGPEADAATDLGADASCFRPMPSRKVWVILALIFVAIAVAILYVYQAGDRKTVLGNQPIPANRDPVQLPPIQAAALHVPGGGGLQDPPVAVAPPEVTPAVAASGMTVRCPHCSTLGLPLCGSCGTVMQPLERAPGSGMYLCPSCGAVGLPICPRCQARMTATGAVGPQHADHPAGQDPGGQFRCPVCGAAGLPNWSLDGTPICPACGARMQVTAGGRM